MAVNEGTESNRFVSCKLSLNKLVPDVNNFRQHVERFLQTMPKYQDWTKELVGISPVLDKNRRAILARHDITPQDLNDLTQGMD